MACIYVLLSCTSTGVGKMIRTCTGSRYNHVSLTLNEDLSGIVSFARLRIDTPLNGGYVREPPERFLYNGGPVPIKVFRVEISEEKALRLREFFAQAGNRELGFLYNHFGAVMTLFRIQCPIPGAYTCLSFAGTVLGKPYRTLQELERDLAPFAVFEGDLYSRCRDSGDRSDCYFTRRGFLRGTKDTLVHMGRLLVRAARIRHFDDSIPRLHGGFP